MSWIQKLYNTYESCKDAVGVVGTDDKMPLLPIAHSTQNAQIEVVLNEGGSFLRARSVEKEEAMTIIPVTEDSAARGSGIEPHPLCDKLKYVAGDYEEFVEDKNKEYYDKYIEKLKAWCSSPYAHKKVQAVLAYLQKKSLIGDLVQYKVLELDNKNKLSKQIKLGAAGQSDAFVRFRVEGPAAKESAVWLDKEVYDSFISYYLSLQGKPDLCYIMAEEAPCAEKHPSKLRNTADKAKLISANDSDGFTYRGRFNDKKQAVSIGYQTSQKAHNALRWLIDRQGFHNGAQVVVAWGTKDQDIPDPLEDTYDILYGKEATTAVNTEKSFAERLNKAVRGYGCDLDTEAEIAIMALEAATTGRLSITYYRELNGRDYLERIESWHSTCSWQHSYKRIEDGLDEKKKPKYKYITFIGAPSPMDIAVSAYGSKLSDELKKSTIERLLLCIVDKAKLPYDLVSSVVNRASNPVAMEKWEWQKVLTIACSLVKKYRYDKDKEVWTMSLDETQRDRSYLFGRLLAIAQQMEEWALRITGENRETNAERLMHQFRLYPHKTWRTLEDKLKPYKDRIRGEGKPLIELMTKVISMISFEDFNKQEKLEDSYILGYHCQLQAFIDERNRKAEENRKKKLEISEEEK